MKTRKQTPMTLCKVLRAWQHRRCPTNRNSHQFYY